jgi:hypothetical protein
MRALKFASKKVLTGSRDALGQPDDGDVVVDGQAVVVLVEGGVRAGDDDAAGLRLVGEVEGTSVDLPGATSEIFHIIIKNATFAEVY